MLDAAEQKLVDDVEKYGFHSLNVGAGNDEPGFRYSIGFWETIGAPDILVFALDSKLTHNMLWEMFRQLKAGAKLADGARWPNLIEGFDCISRPVHPSQMREYFGFGLWYHRYRGVDPDTLKAYQLFWPGAKQGLFPWESGCVAEVIADQPLLYLPRKSGLA